MTIENILDNYEPMPIVGCWLWMGACGSGGYGRVRFQGRTQLVHRVIWEHFHGEIPEGMCVLHKCDTPPCCNLSHLFLGSNADNSQDMVAKGRESSGETHPTAKLTKEDVLKIYFLRKDGWILKAIAKEFGVSKYEVGCIVIGKRWKRLYEEMAC